MGKIEPVGESDVTLLGDSRGKNQVHAGPLSSGGCTGLPNVKDVWEFMEHRRCNVLSNTM